MHLINKWGSTLLCLCQNYCFCEGCAVTKIIIGVCVQKSVEFLRARAKSSVGAALLLLLVFAAMMSWKRLRSSGFTRTWVQ